MRRRRKPAFYVPPRPAEPLDFEAAELARARHKLIRRFDDLAPAIREALRQCPFDIHIGLKGNLNAETMVARIKAIRSEGDAIRFNDEFAARGFGRVW